MSKPRVAVLMYHAIQVQRSAISIHPELFEQQMRWLSEQDIEVLAINRLVRNLREGIKPTKHTVVLTFDDGFRELKDAALPVLQKYQFPATIYLVTGYCGKQNNWPGQPDGIPRLPLLSWNHILEMEASGIEFGAHTVNHPILDKIDPAEAAWEIRQAKQVMQEQLGHAVHSFAYPYGRFNQQIKQLVADTFDNACSTDLGFVEDTFDPFAIARIDVSYFQQPAMFKRLFEPVTPYYLRVRKSARKLASRVLARPWQ